MHRLRVKFRRGEEVKFISHLDIMRLWQRALHRAAIPLAYSKGFSPHPQISLAAPLAVGITSEAELMDILFTKLVAPHWFTSAVSRQLPPGTEIIQVSLIALEQPSLQAQVRFAEYRVEVETEKERKDVEAAIERLFALKQLPWQHQRDTGPHKYDLRALVEDIRLIDWRPDCGILDMRLRCDSGGSGRPEQVAIALGFTGHPRSIHRTRLILKTG